MKKLPFFIVATVLLSACGSAPRSLTMNELMQNPLYADYYWTDLVDTLTNVQIDATARGNADFLKDERNVEKLEYLKKQAMESMNSARSVQDEAGSGFFNRETEETHGFTMLHNNNLYVNPAFISHPGPQLHIYLSPLVDPRDDTFPNADTIDLGLLQSAYGAQTYVLSKTPEKRPNSVVLYDTVLKRIFGFAQLGYGPKAL